MSENYNGTSQDRLVALINEDNDKELVLGEDFTLGPVSEFEGTEGRNTKVTLIVPEGSEFSDTEITYTRLPITVLGDLEAPIVELPAVFPFTTHDILDAINAAFGTELSEDEVQNLTYDDVSEDDTYPLTIVEGSYAWLPSTFNFIAAQAG